MKVEYLNTNNIAYLLNRYELDKRGEEQNLSEPCRYINGSIIIEGIKINNGTHIKVLHLPKNGHLQEYWLSWIEDIYPIISEGFYLPMNLG